MVHWKERYAKAPSKRLAVAEANQERPDKPGTESGGNGRQVSELQSGFLQRAGHRVVDGAQVLTARLLGDHASELGVQAGLSQDDVGTATAVHDDADTGVVARGIDAQDSVHARDASTPRRCNRWRSRGRVRRLAAGPRPAGWRGRPRTRSPRRSRLRWDQHRTG